MKSEVFPKTTKLLTVVVAVILVLVPFHAFLTVWAASLFGHYTAWRLWDEVLLIVGSLIAVTLLAFQPKLWKALVRQHLLWLIIAYGMLQLIIGGVALPRHDVTAKALGYGLIVNLRFLLFFLLCLVVASRNDWLRLHWKQLLLIPAAIVIIFGLLQHFVLPYDFLKHFGYNASTIYPFETINHNLKYIRIMSTLRGANPLGAYLIIVISALTVLFVKEKIPKWRAIYGAFGLAALATLLFSYSRSAWLGAILAMLIVFGLCIKNTRARRISLAGIAALVIICGAGTLAFKNNVFIENLVTHTQQHSAIKTTSDQGHLDALKSGLSDVLHEPLGDGPGTAGPASVYNNHPPRIAEDYFIQVAQEVGWLGLVLFVLINYLTAKGLWLIRKEALPLVLLASLIGICLVGFLSHVWVDDTLSYTWWGLAGIALAPLLKSPEK